MTGCPACQQSNDLTHQRYLLSPSTAETPPVGTHILERVERQRILMSELRRVTTLDTEVIVDATVKG